MSRKNDSVTQVTFTLPASHEWTTTEAALKAAYDSEYELRMAFFMQNQYLIAENERLISENDLLRKAVEASLEHLESGFTSEYRVVEACKAALHGGSTNPPDQA